MNKRNNRSSSKIAIVSTIIVIALVGISVMSVKSLANLDIANTEKAAAEKAEVSAPSKLLTVVEADEAVAEKIEAEPVEPVAQARVASIDLDSLEVAGSLVVVDSVVASSEDYDGTYDPEESYKENNYQKSFEELPSEDNSNEEQEYDDNYDDAELAVASYEEYSYEDYEDYVDYEDYEDYSYEEPETAAQYEEPETTTRYVEPETTTRYVEPETTTTYYEPEPEYVETSYSYVDTSFGQQIANYASQWAGVTPYVWAGRSLETGTDCSGFVYLVYGTFGIYASPCAGDYQAMGNISYDELAPGDVVVYRYGEHVAIYLGNDTIVHASNENVGTIISNMWYSTPTAYVRLY